MSFPHIRTIAREFPSTILTFMNIQVPDGLPPANADLVSKFSPSGVVMMMVDNFGLFEAVVYRPECMIKNLEVLALIEDCDPYAVSLTKSLLSTGSGLSLIEHVRQFGKSVRVVCREDDMDVFGFHPAYTVTTRDDMSTYVESTKLIGSTDLLYLHFLDFESLYAQYGHMTPPKTLLEKIVRRIDNWTKILLKLSRVGTLFVIVGNHGRHVIPVDYEGKLAEWRSANAPVALIFQKRSE
ncbi:MAG: hypothetical protein QXS20_04415 [Candidatus Thorarchaeota archaeon]